MTPWLWICILALAFSAALGGGVARAEPVSLRAVEARLLCQGLPPAVLRREEGVWRVPAEALGGGAQEPCDVAVLYEAPAGEAGRLAEAELEAEVDGGQGFASFLRGEAGAVRIAASASLGAASVIGPWRVLSGGARGFTLRVLGFTPEGEQTLTSNSQRFEIEN